jgi:hypothetical protein
VFYVCPATDHARLYNARNKNEFVSVSDMPLPVARKIHALAALHCQCRYAVHLIAHPIELFACPLRPRCDGACPLSPAAPKNAASRKSPSGKCEHQAFVVS